MVCLGLGGRGKHTHTLQDNPILQARILIVEGSSSTLGVNYTFGEVRPSLGRRRGQHHARAIAARVFSRNPARADGSAGHPEASASCPPRTLARFVASTTQLRRRSRQWTTRPGSGRPNLLFEANFASIRADTATSGFGSSKSGRGFHLTKQEKPRAERPTEPRDSYASGIRIPHSSPLHEATHAW
jgi:hypothetical protein